MKKVLNTNDVAHFWADRTQEEGRNSGGNFYFKGDTIYSYGGHFPIAKHVTNERGERAVLFTTRSYSNTTAKHISKTRNGANHLNIIYCYNPAFVNIPQHQDNFNSWKTRAENVSKNLVKAKKPELYLNSLDQIKGEAQTYATFFGIELPETLNLVLSISGKEDYLNYSTAKELAKKKEEAKRQRELKKQHAKELAEFRGFKRNTLYTRNGIDFLRLNEGEARIETSQGVQIPVEIGKRFWRVIQHTISKGGCANCGLPLLNYTVNEINKDFISVGCHKIEFKELQNIANLLGLQ